MMLPLAGHSYFPPYCSCGFWALVLIEGLSENRVNWLKADR
jgi:hypothetical protein